MLDLAATLDQARRSHLEGRLDAAETAYRAVLEDDPSLGEVWYLLGRACQSLGKNDEAIASYRQALMLRPALVEAHSNLGIALKNQGRVEEAMACYREAIRLRPGYLEAHLNLGNALEQRGQGVEAIECYRSVIRQRPEFAEAHNNLGIALKGQRRWGEAVASLREAVRLQPDFAEAHANLAFVLTELRQDVPAMASYDRALALKPDFAPALCGRANLVASRGDHEAAETLLRASIEVRPDSAELWGSLGFVLAEQGWLARGFDAYQQSLRLRPESASTWSNYLYHRNYDPEVTSETLLADHHRGAALLGVPASFPEIEPVEGRPLRVGYVSPDFRKHAVASFLEPIIASHDPRRVQVYCYSDVGTPDATTARIRSFAHAWREIRPLNDRAVEQLIRQDRIDILVDLAGHTARNRLGVFARKAAPVQLNYLGYPFSTGLAAIDGLLTDALIDPPDRSPWSVEKPVRIPGTFCCFRPDEDADEVSPPPSLANEFPTFGSLHKLPKLNREVVALWSKLLLAVPGSRLLLIRDSLKGQRGRQILMDFEAHGVDPGRVEMRHDWSADNHWDNYASIDLMLDVFPWSGHTTACESLWMGVPVVTLIGERRCSRLTASVLAAIGLDDLIARNAEDYVETAARWVSDPHRLARWRAGWRERMRASRLCDARGFTRDLETAYESFWIGRIGSRALD